MYKRWDLFRLEVGNSLHEYEGYAYFGVILSAEPKRRYVRHIAIDIGLIFWFVKAAFYPDGRYGDEK